MVVACSSLDQSNINIELETTDLKNHIKKLNWKVKDQINLNQILADSIKTESDLLRIADLENKNDQKYLYEFRSINVTNETDLNINYKVKLLEAPNVIAATFVDTIEGFKSNNPVLNELKEIAKQATFSVNDKKRLASSVKAEEINWIQQKDHPDIAIKFEKLIAQDWKGFLGFKIIFSKEKTNFELMINPDDVKAIQGFEQIQVGKLDTMESPNIILPEGAVSYKGTLAIKPDFPPVIEHAKFKQMIDWMTWEDFVKEMLYQVRFMLYQQYSDNFSEIDYYTIVDEKHKRLTVEATGIIKEDMTKNHQLEGIDNLNPGGPNYYVKPVSYKKGDVVKINFRSRWDESDEKAWRPMAPASFHKFSYADSPEKINSTKKRVFLVGITKWYLNWTKNTETIYQENTLSFRNPVFVFWYVPKAWKEND